MRKFKVFCFIEHLTLPALYHLHSCSASWSCNETSLFATRMQYRIQVD
jgi:hypothetical protein